MIDVLTEIFREPMPGELQTRTVLVPAEHAEQIAGAVDAVEGYEVELMADETPEDRTWAVEAHLLTFRSLAPILGYAGENLNDMQSEATMSILLGESRVLRVAACIGAGALPEPRTIRPYADEA